MTTDPVLFAEAPDGTRLPVIDLSLPQFAVPDSPQAVAELEAKALEEQRQRGPVQRAAMAVMLKAMAGQSRLIQALQDARRAQRRGKRPLLIAGVAVAVVAGGAAAFSIIRRSTRPDREDPRPPSVDVQPRP